MKNSKWSVEFRTQYHYDPSSGKPPSIYGIASRTTVDSEGDLIASFDEASVDYLRRWGKLDYNHKGTIIGQITNARLVNDDEAADLLLKGIGGSGKTLYIEGRLFPITSRSPKDLHEVYYLMESGANIGLSIEGRARRIEKSYSEYVGAKRIIYGLQLAPRVAVTPTPVHPEASIILVKSATADGKLYGVEGKSVEIEYSECWKCGFALYRKYITCPKCGNPFLW